MIKRLALLSLYAFALLATVSCYFNDDRDPVETMFSGFMTGETDSKGKITILKNDFGLKYRVTEQLENIKLRPDTVYRIVASVALDESNNARIIQMVKAMSYIATPDSIIPDSMRGTDPVEIESIYVGGGYLNVLVGVKVQNEESDHDLFYTRLDTPGKYTFKIYHKAYGDREMYTKHAYISIPLWGYGLTKNDTVFLSCKGYKEDYDYKLNYK